MRVAEILHLQRVTGNGSCVGTIEPAECDGSLACDKRATNEHGSVVTSDSCLEECGPRDADVYMTAKEERRCSPGGGSVFLTTLVFQRKKGLDARLQGHLKKIVVLLLQSLDGSCTRAL
jgi:hypothetical protein